MSIPSSQYLQFHDYLTQLLHLSGRGQLPKINQTTIATQLHVDDSGVCRFLGKQTASPKKMMQNFTVSYPLEFQKWPKGLNTINRALQESDGWYFIKLQPPVLERPLPLLKPSLPRTPNLPKLPATANGKQLARAVPAKTESRAAPLYREQEGFVNLGSASQSKIDPNERDHCTPCKASEEDRFYAGIASPNSQNLPAHGINAPQGFPRALVASPNSPDKQLIRLFRPKIQPHSSVARAPNIILRPSIPGAKSLGKKPIREVERRRGLHFALPKAPIAISYRGYESEKDAQGMLFDHMRFQDLTNFPTWTLLPEEERPKERAERIFMTALRNHPAKMPYGTENEQRIKHPPFTLSSAEAGLMVIPGRVHKIENEPIRLRHEYQVIRQALNRGQPILGICAGSWRIWEQLRIWTRCPERLSRDPMANVNWHEAEQTLVDAADHTYNGGMIRLDKMGVKATLNVQLHDVIFEETSWIKKASKIQAPRISVNSVHWKAVNEEALPLNVKISGRSIENSSLQKRNRQGNLMHPDENMVEAFESLAGAPIAGIQWHPEGYNLDDAEGAFHGHFLKYMALAGSAYAAKRKMLQELPKKD